MALLPGQFRPGAVAPALLRWARSRAPAAQAGLDPTRYGTVIEWNTIREAGLAVGAAVTEIPGLVNSRAYTQSTGSAQGEVSNTDPPGVLFDGDDRYLNSSRAPFDVMHQAGGTIVAHVSGVGSDGNLVTFWANKNLSSTSRGAALTVDDRSTTPNRVRFEVSNGSAYVYVSNSASYDLGTILTSGRHVLMAAWDGSTARLYFDGTQLGPALSASGSLDAVNTSADDPTIGGAAGGVAFRMVSPNVLYDTICYSDPLTAAEAAALSAELLA